MAMATQTHAAPKADMLPVTADTATKGFVTVEQRADGMSVLARIPATTVVE